MVPSHLRAQKLTKDFYEQLSDVNAVNMLYKIEEGVEERDNYGIALARVMPFPKTLLDRAAIVSDELRKQSERKEERGSSSTIMLERRRKLILNLKERLLQLRSAASTAATNEAGSSTNGNDRSSSEDTCSISNAMLTARLKELRRNFVLDMTALMDDAD